jgi:hypothetical protein
MSIGSMHDASQPAPRERETLNELLRRQRGLILRRQALRLGMTGKTLQRRVAQGRWQRILLGLYSSSTEQLSEEQRLVAAALYAGRGSQITGPAALRWHGVRYAPQSRQVHALIPASAHRASRGFVTIIRTTRPDQRPSSGSGLAICSLARATADAARTSRSLREVRAFVAEVVQRELVTIKQLTNELCDGPVAGSALLRQVVDELAAGVRSAPEAELRTLLSSSTVLPPVLWNPRLVTANGKRLPPPDGWIQEVGLALEVDSREHHSEGEGWERTLDRSTFMGTYGVLVLHFTPRRIRESPAQVLETVEHAYLERRRTGAPFTAVHVLEAQPSR